MDFAEVREGDLPASQCEVRSSTTMKSDDGAHGIRFLALRRNPRGKRSGGMSVKPPQAS